MSAEQISASYEQVPYPGRPFPELHPGRMAVHGLLHGLEAAPVERCRVLELGCGDGGNLMPMAWGLPGSEFVGIDVARGPIAAATERARMLGVDNVRFREADLSELDAGLGSFDYVIANGVYSWVPEAVRDRLLEQCRERLGRHGVAVISFKVRPGALASELAHDLLRLHTRTAADGRQRVAAARELLELVPGALPQSAYGRWASEHLERVSGFSDAALYHDEMTSEHDALLLTDFVEHAERSGLRYLGDVDPRTSRPVGMSDRARGVLDRLGGDALAREQYLDFLTGRPFRQALLCRREAKVDAEPSAQRIDRLHAAARLQPKGKVDLSRTAVTQFRAPDGGKLATDDALLKAALLALAGDWPRRVAFDELLSRARERVPAAGGAGGPGDRDRAALAALFMQGHAEGVLELSAHAPELAPRPYERPAASELARRQAQAGGDWVASLLHAPVPLANAETARLLTLLDGSRDRAALASELKGTSPKELERTLGRFAELGLLGA